MMITCDVASTESADKENLSWSTVHCITTT